MHISAVAPTPTTRLRSAKQTSPRRHSDNSLFVFFRFCASRFHFFFSFPRWTRALASACPRVAMYTARRRGLLARFRPRVHDGQGKAGKGGPPLKKGGKWPLPVRPRAVHVWGQRTGTPSLTRRPVVRFQVSTLSREPRADPANQHFRPDSGRNTERLTTESESR